MDASEHLPGPELAERWFGNLIPDLQARTEQFRSDLNVVDDELIQLFVEELNRASIGLMNAMEHADFMEIRNHAHTLQGMGGTAGAPEISVLGEAISLSAKAEDLSRCRHYLVAFQGWLSEWTQPSGQVSVIESMPRLEGRLLVVDDELANRRFLEKLLGDCGATVLLAENGEQALEMIRLQRPDVALVDVMMPGISGYEVCAEVAQRPELNQTAVIMVTARSSVEDIEHAFLQGAFDYIRKPFHSRELVARVRNALLLKRNTDALHGWKSRVSRELEMAGAVQKKLFNPTPVLGPRFNFKVAYRPSQQVGGDMFDLHRLPEDRMILFVADVAGHGVASALISTLIKGLMSEIISSMREPGLFEIGNELHRRFRHCVLEPEIYATMMLMRVDCRTRRVESLSCGHPPPLVVAVEGQVLEGHVPEHGGMPIGMMPPEFGTPYAAEDEVHFDLPEGASLLLYTDGLVEARDASGEECGGRGLSGLVSSVMQRGSEWHDPDDVLKALEQRGYDIGADDCSLLALYVLSEAEMLGSGQAEGTLEDADRLSAEISGLLEAEGWGEEDAMLLRLLAMEHLVNVVKHGRLPAAGQMGFRLNRAGETCTLMMWDDGCDWKTEFGKSRQAASDFAESGRGLALMDQIAPGKLRFRRDNQNYTLYFLKKEMAARLQAEMEAEEDAP